MNDLTPILLHGSTGHDKAALSTCAGARQFVDSLGPVESALVKIALRRSGSQEVRVGAGRTGST